MTSYYVTFGQAHRHQVGGKIFDADCVCRIVADDYFKARQKAFEMFGKKWCWIYQDFLDVGIDRYPRGLIDAS